MIDGDLLFKFGDQVTGNFIAVPKYLKRGKTSHRVFGRQKVPKFSGKVCGVSLAGEGVITGETRITSRFKCSKRILLYEVKLGFINKPIKVFESDVTIDWVEGDKALPNYFRRNKLWTEEDKTVQREKTSKQPRRNGRFVSYNKAKKK